MNCYQKYIEPAFVDFACGTKPISKQREKVVPRARGQVLEIGAGSGRNFPYYDAGNVERIFALEPAVKMRDRAKQRKKESAIEIEWLDLPTEEIPLESRTIDTVLVTYTLCTIPDVAKALAQIYRVMKPEGDLIFCEHGLAPDPKIETWQKRINPVWGLLAGGCNLNRNIPKLITGAGFKMIDVEQMYLPGTPKFAGYNYWGTAKPI